MKIYSLLTGTILLDGGAMFGTTPRVEWLKRYPVVNENMTLWEVRSLLIVEGDRRILIDTGMGTDLPPAFYSEVDFDASLFSLETSLQHHGFSFASITDVILTHLHYDHCGGMVKTDESSGKLVPAFPNAIYHVGAFQWKTALNPSSFEHNSFCRPVIEAVAERVNFVYKDGLFCPGVELRMMHGHTSGQLIPVIRKPGWTMVFCADLLPSQAHVPLRCIMAYDIQPAISVKEKKKLLLEAEKNKYLLFLQHDHYHECCRIRKNNRGKRVADSLSLQEAGIIS